jgi:hypothetical protein
MMISSFFESDFRIIGNRCPYYLAFAYHIRKINNISFKNFYDLIGKDLNELSHDQVMSMLM